MGKVLVKEEDTQATPAAGYNKLYPKTDGKWYYKNDAGTEVEIANASAAPASHASSHKGDGSDPIAVATQSVDGLMSSEDKTKLDGLSGTGVAAHATTHQDGGSDEISVAGLSGVLADRQDANKILGVDINVATPTRRNHLVYDEIAEEWINEKLPVVPYGPVRAKDWSPTWSDIEEYYKFIPVNTEPALTSHVGNGTVSYLNSITGSAVMGDTYTVTDTGTLNGGALSVSPGQIVMWYGVGWVTAVIPGDGGVVVAGLMVQLSTTTALISPYTDGTDDGKLIAFDGTDLVGEETSQDITITLPDPADLDFNDGTIKGMYYVGKMATTGTVKVVCSGTVGAFMDGVESVLLEDKMQQATLAVVNATLASVWMRISQIHDVIQVRRAATWADSNFSTRAIIPFDTQDIEGNPDITSWESVTNPGRVTFNAAGTYHISFHIEFDYTANAEYGVDAYITKNGSALAGTEVAAGGYRGDCAIALPPVSFEFAVDDYIDIRVLHSNFTGTLKSATLIVERDY